MIELLNYFPNVFDIDHHHRRRGGATDTDGGGGAFPVDILDSPENRVFYIDVPGLSKSDIQVTLEDGNTLVIKSNGKRKRRQEEHGDEEEHKYARLERRPIQNVTRRFRLPENSDPSSITAKCENGVLTVVVPKLPRAPEHSKFEVKIS